MSKIQNLIKKTSIALKEEGFQATIQKSIRFLKNRMHKDKWVFHFEYKDILFVNGCSLPHPQRYRVDHQIQQLEMSGLTCNKVYYDEVTEDMAKFYRAIIIYRCPIIPSVENLIKNAKENNKIVFYDIDDLVFDVKDAKKLDALKTMTEEEKKLYFDGVQRMGRTLALCDYGIASTNRIKIEMEKHVKEVFVNRNVASEEMVYFSKQALKEKRKEDDKIVIGYLSGSITHNADFELIKPVIKEILKTHDNVYLKIGGLLNIPNDMLEVKDKIITTPFVDYKCLPNVICTLDINIAPLEDNIFNEAKSENKWTEASLVKVPTIASNVGAFKDSIIHGKTGILCNNNEEWKSYLEELITNSNKRKEIAENAYNEVMKNHITISNPCQIRDFILSKLHKNIFFVLPTTNVSGGILVAIKHAQILKDNGYDVTIINGQNNQDPIINKDGALNIIPACLTSFTGHVDTIVATMWLTLEFAKNYLNKNRVKYLVQGYETDFYKENDRNRIKCESTYHSIDEVEYITISKWCYDWLTKKYHKKVKYAPNGIDLDIFQFKKRIFKGKIKILIEGNSNDYFKNVDESFEIVNKLNKQKFEINYMSYEKEPKKTYYVDHFYHKVPHDEVGKIFSDHDILIKTSLLESFSYPPLEMMATGGVCLVLQNPGNKEFLVDGKNCYMYQKGNIEDAIGKINEICENKELRDTIIEEGLKTAQSRKWENIESEILKLYE